MPHQIENASEALRQSSGAQSAPLALALCRCPSCDTTRAIMSPRLGDCNDCGTSLIIDSAQEATVDAA